MKALRESGVEMVQINPALLEVALADPDKLNQSIPRALILIYGLLNLKLAFDPRTKPEDVWRETSDGNQPWDHPS